MTVEKRAQQRVYRLDAAALATAEGWLSDRARQWTARLDRMTALLEKTPRADDTRKPTTHERGMADDE